jgi:hypothetical protein
MNKYPESYRLPWWLLPMTIIGTAFWVWVLGLAWRALRALL